MKTSKTKAISKPIKTTKVGKAVKGKEVPSSRSLLSEEEIREKAREIYYERIARGEQGTAENDWIEAEQILRGS